jgi:hypothetical protein
MTRNDERSVVGGRAEDLLKMPAGAWTVAIVFPVKVSPTTR